MKKTQVTYLFRTIWKNLVSFLAVAMMAATGISIYLGDQSAAQAILDTANRYFLTNELQNLEVTSPYWITEEDIALMAEWDNVDGVEGGYSAVVLVDTDNGTGKMLVQANALLDTMNIPEVMEGVLPANAGEVAVEQVFAENEGVNIGDVITVEHEGELKKDTFMVTAIINQPSYCYARTTDIRGQSDIGIGSAYYYISFYKDAFDDDYYDGCYTTAYIRNKELDQYHYFSEKYEAKEQEFIEQIKEQGAERSRIRYEAVKAEMPEKLAKARAELERQEKNLSDAYEMMDFVLTSVGVSTDFEVAKEQLSSYEKLKEPMEQMIEAFELGEQALEEARDSLAQKEEAAANLEYYDWIVSGRNDIGDVRSVDIAVEGLYGLSYSMAIIFVIVGITVCYAAISRMISESSNLIGMQKALGFSTKEILKHFMLYSILCGVWGMLEGWLVGYAVVQKLNLNIYKTVFLIGDIPLAFSWTSAGLVSGLFLVIFVVSAYVACARRVNLAATELLRGENVQRDRTFWFERIKLYKNLRLYTKTIIKNVLVDKARLLTTVMGVAGCATLLVICFTLLLSMKESETIQFEKYYLYENRLVIDSTKTDGSRFEEILDKENISYTRIQDKLRFCREEDGEWSGAHVVAAPAGQSLKDFMVLEEVGTREILEIPEEGVLVSLRCAENYGLEKGSEFEIMGSDGEARAVTVSGIIEHYLSYNLVVFSESYYETIFGEQTDDCVFLLKGSIDGLYDKVQEEAGFLSLRDNSEYKGLGDVMNVIVIICFVFAALMAVLVMLNQNVMYINQKAKELSVMRINGFTLKETKTFVSRDNFVLTVMGILAGWVIGLILGHQVLLILEVGVSHYVRTPRPDACLIAAAICGIFAFAMNRIAVRKISELNLTDVNAN